MNYADHIKQHLERKNRMETDRDFCFVWLSERLQEPQWNKDFYLDEWLRYEIFWNAQNKL